MRYSIGVALAVAVALGLYAATADAQTGGNCGPRKGMFAALLEHYGEAPTAMGLDAQGRVMELLASPDGGTWTLTLTSPDGMACILVAGTAFGKAIPQAPRGEAM